MGTRRQGSGMGRYPIAQATVSICFDNPLRRETMQGSVVRVRKQHQGHDDERRG